MRRTKEEAAQTRAAIVDAGLACFDRHGIAGTTLEEIATEAGVTKGAIYHHFGGKQAILHELREQVALPLLDEADTTLLHHEECPALERVERFLVSVLDSLERNERQRRALAVMLFKCEYVDGLADELAGNLRNNIRLTRAFEAAYESARKQKQLAAGVDPAVAALETAMFLSGMLRLWLMHAPRSPLRKTARAAIAAHVASRRRPAPRRD
jgi:TetR/AcrR family transcriptional regulator, acrAB operon repressor